ncbi:MAG: FixH family protein, partial [Gammaproteobacteria bacterium]|nr:FixH family protein [Gammaproteobacteria bacterium]
PWYKQFWPWFIIFFPLVAVVAGLTTVVIAYKKADDLVVDDYYKEGLAINQVMDKDRRAGEMGFSASIMLNRENQQLRLILKRETSTVLPDKLQLSLLHPTQAVRDKVWIMDHENGGVYSTKTGPLNAGSWYVVLEPDDKEWRLTGRIALPRETSVTLKPDN